MNTIRITKKLKEAITVLADEGKADCSDEAFVLAIKEGKIKPAELYKVLSQMRYSWIAKRGYWIWRPRHLKSVKRIFGIVRKIDDARFVEAAL